MSSPRKPTADRVPRIGFISITPASHWGGSEELWSRAVKRLRVEGVDTAACVRWNEGIHPNLRALLEDGLPVAFYDRPCPLPVRAWRKVRPADPFAWLDAARLTGVVISRGDHISGLEWIEACRDRGLPYVVVSHSVHESRWPNDETAARLAAALEAARACYSVSASCVERARLQFAAPLENAHVVRNPFNVAYDAAPEWPDDSTTLKLACVGRLDFETKGQDLLLRVLATPKWRGRSLQVDFIGGGRNSGALRKIIERDGLANARAMGHTADIQAVWREHHGLVMPSREEGLPLALVEAMLCARPAIVSDVGGNSEVVADGETGFLADAATVPALDAALERAWERRLDWQAMGRTAAQSIRRIIPEDPVGDFTQRVAHALSLSEGS